MWRGLMVKTVDAVFHSGQITESEIGFAFHFRGSQLLAILMSVTLLCRTLFYKAKCAEKISKSWSFVKRNRVGVSHLSGKPKKHYYYQILHSVRIFQQLSF